jgi:hypothetical protein
VTGVRACAGAVTGVRACAGAVTGERACAGAVTGERACAGALTDIPETNYISRVYFCICSVVKINGACNVTPYVKVK